MLAEQGLPRVKAFSAPHPTEAAMGLHKGSEGATARTADHTSPKGYATSHGFKFSMQSGRKEKEAGGRCLE